MLHAVLRCAIIPAIALLFLGQVHAQDEVRALWVVRIILFSYDSLAAPANGPGSVSQIGRATFTTSHQ